MHREKLISIRNKVWHKFIAELNCGFHLFHHLTPISVISVKNFVDVLQMMPFLCNSHAE